MPLESIFTGRLGGDANRHFPWVWKASELVALRLVGIEVDHTRRRQWLRIRDRVSLRSRGAYPGDETVTCVIPGHETSGEELVADELVVEDGPISLSYRGTCGPSSSAGPTRAIRDGATPAPYRCDPTAVSARTSGRVGSSRTRASR